MRLVQEHIAPGMSNMRPETVNEMRARVAAERRALSPCEYFGDAIPGESADCKTCTAKRGQPTRQPVYGCEIYGKCTPRLPSPKIACCAGCPHNPGKAEPAIKEPLPVAPSIPCTETVIDIPKEYRRANAFNPSIIDWQGKLLIAYRDTQLAGSRIWIGELDRKTFQLSGAPWRLNLDHPKAIQGQEDPRFFVWRGRLCLSFAGVQPVRGKTLVHVMLASLADDLTVESVWEPQYAERTPIEKNWLFFDHGGTLHSLYSVNPHVILRHDGDRAVKAHQISHRFRWPMHMRGGALWRVGEEWWHFFHTTKRDGSHWWYSMGLMTFSTSPPFAPLRCIPDPIYTPDHRTRPIGSNKSVAFPCGVVADLQTGTILCSLGIHDMESRLLTYDMAELTKAMVKI